MKRTSHISIHIVFLFCLGIICACSSPNKFEIDNLNANTIGIFGHGGSGNPDLISNPPFNSWESIGIALEEENVGIELDVQLSFDGQLILFHDRKLEDQSSCEGLVREHTLIDLKKCLLSNGEVLISLSELLVSYENRPLKIALDVKLNGDPEDANYKHDFADAIVSLLGKMEKANSGFMENVFVESMESEFLKLLKERDVELKLFYYTTDPEHAILVADSLAFYGITMKQELINSVQIKRAHEHGIRVALWGMKSVSSIQEAVSKSPDFIQTDHISNAIDMLRTQK